ncbi:hypothetical protein KR093_000367, partial [Drosophila rubida]
TTVIAAEYEGGVVLAANSLIADGGNYGLPGADKLVRLSEYLYCCSSGTVGQAERLTKTVLDNVYPMITIGFVISVHLAAMMFHTKIYMDRRSYFNDAIVAGWDKKGGGQVYYIGPSGTMVHGAAVSGAGANIARGYLTSNHRKNLPLKDVLQLVKNAVEIVITNEPRAGGVVRLLVINKNGLATSRIVPINNQMFAVSNFPLWELEL